MVTSVPAKPSSGDIDWIPNVWFLNWGPAVAWSFTTTFNSPVGVPSGTTNVILVAEIVCRGISWPAIYTRVSPSSSLKVSPIITISVPAGPLNGVTEVMVGNGTTVKSGPITGSSAISTTTGPLSTSSGAITTN